jgi:hypothetical protein
MQHLAAWRVIRHHRDVALSHRTLALLARPFEHGSGPTHSTIELIWTTADAFEYLPSEDLNKVNRVLSGLRTLSNGGRPQAGAPELRPDQEKLRLVVGDLAARLLAANLLDSDEFDGALANDGFDLRGGALAPSRLSSAPADRLTDYVTDLLAGRSDFEIAARHYEQANRAFDRGDWEAGNAQFRSACDAVFDALAHRRGCPDARRGGQARKWLQENGHLESDEADLTRSFMAFAGRAGSHAGVSEAADAQLRRHLAAALISFGVMKLG